MTIKFNNTFVLIFIFNLSLLSQNELKYKYNKYDPQWVKIMYSENSNPDKLIKAYNEFYSKNEFIKNRHTQYYKRFLRSFSRNELSNASSSSYVNRSLNSNNKSTSSIWESKGPWDFDKNAASSSYAPGAAHIYTVKRCSSDSSVMYAGTATAGVWKSLDGGLNWSLVTKNLMVNSVFALEIDHSDPNIIYFESGGKLYKSSDGGLNWTNPGDINFISLSHSVKDIIMSPQSSSILYLTSENGFYITYDGGNNWTQIMIGDFQEIEINPSNPNIIYTIKLVGNKTEFYKSTDGGINFSIKTNGWPSPNSSDEQKRVEIAVTPAAPDYIYANATGQANGGSGTYGIYFSNDAGESWTFRCCGEQPSGPASLSNPNLMGWSDDGTDDGGQYYYDVALEVDPYNPDKLHLGGINHWISTDGGFSFICPAKWSHGDSDQYVHADIHDIRYLGNELWFACDGGLFKSSDGGETIYRSMNGIEGTDFWGFGSSTKSNVMLGGAYHNGTLLKDNNTYINDWISTGGGDGVRGFVNPGNDRLAYDDYEGRILSGNRTIPIGSFQFDSLPNSSYIIGASSEMAFHPANYNTILIGRNNLLLKTTNNGQTFETLHDFNEEVMAIEIAWSNPDVIYVTTYPDWWGDKKIWKSSDSGISWHEITPSSTLLGGDNWVPFDITVSSIDENILWAARTSQYGGNYPNLDNRQVFKTTNGGNTWVNITSAELDGESITNIIHQRGSNGGVYLGTRRAVYYLDDNLNTWVLYNNNLPLSTSSTKIIPHYKDSKLINATCRSVYECDFFATSPPVAQISVDKFKLSCFDTIVNFVDNSAISSNNPSWQWSFPGGNPDSSTDQNPIITYNSAGSYDVSLTVSDDFGTSTQTYSEFIHFEDIILPLDVIEDFEDGFSSDWRLKNSNNSFNWTIIDVPNGPQCEPTKCAYLEHYYINQNGEVSELISPYIDLNGYINPKLNFDYAYATYSSTYQDGFRVDISSNCGKTWNTVYYAFGDTLATVGPQNNWWEPSDCSDWLTENNIDLTTYSGQQIMLRFVAINGYGNNFFLDNIKVTGNPSDLLKMETRFAKIYPNPSKGDIFIHHNMNHPKIKIFSIDGRLVYKNEIKEEKALINVSLSPGIYHLKIGDNKYLKNIVTIIE